MGAQVPVGISDQHALRLSALKELITFTKLRTPQTGKIITSNVETHLICISELTIETQIETQAGSI